MKYKLTHSTIYKYDEPVPVCHNQLRLTPRDGAADGRADKSPLSRTGLICRSHRITIRPTPAFSLKRKDCFGNQVHSISIESPHRQMTVTASSRIELRPADVPEANGTEPWEHVRESTADGSLADWFDSVQFAFDSPLITRSQELAAYGRESFAKDRPVLDALIDLTARIHADFQYDTKATEVTTTAHEAFKLRKGVCQDLAHVQIGCLRSLGLPARYVSGYLRTLPAPGKPRLVGADQSHAWLSVHCGAIGWIDVDPTNNVVCSTDHITLAWGREYSDVCPIKGVFTGGGHHHLSVSVDVAPVD